jgi:hypothetical protein
VKGSVKPIFVFLTLLSAIACSHGTNVRAAVAPAAAARAAVAATSPQAAQIARWAAEVAPSKRVYVARIFSDGQAHRLGFRSLELSDATYNGANAWLLMESRTMGTVVLAESLFVSKSNGAPLYRVAHTPDSQIDTHFTPDSVVTTFSGDSGVVRVSLPDEAGLVGNIYWLEPVLATLPLANGWKGNATTLFVGRHDHARVVMQMEVVGQDSVQVPDGTFDCWMMNLQVGDTQEHLWIRKSDRVLIKQDTPVAGIAGAKVQLLLAEGQTKGATGK